MTDVQIVVYEGFDELDAIAPYEVCDTAARLGADIDVRLVTLEQTDIVEASHGLRLEPHGTLGDPDVVIVPGGGWNDRARVGAWNEVEKGDISEAIARLHDAGATVASVCTGGMILAHAGILDGRPATTHASALSDLHLTNAEAHDERVVDDGSVLTSGGVTSGIDLALHLVERLADEETAAAVATEIEHERRAAYRH